MSRKTPLLAALAFAGALAAGAVQARDHADVQWSVTIGAPLYGAVVGSPAYRYPVPVYVPPVVVQPQYQWQHQPQWQQVPQGYRDRDRDGIPNRYDRVDNRWRDSDRDGIPNRYDRVYNPRWDRDGDGVPNRYDRFPGYPGHPGHPGR